MKICNVCKIEKPFDDFGKEERRKSGYRSTCKPCERYRTKVFREQNPDHGKKWVSENKDKVRKIKQRQHHSHSMAQHLWIGAKRRARENNYPFDIEIEDIVVPEFCPLLNIPMFKVGKVKTSNSPSLDKVIPSRGYVRGNIQVISFRANSLKSDATLDELKSIVRGLESFLKEK